jgi:hypothetical protein
MLPPVSQPNPLTLRAVLVGRASARKPRRLSFQSSQDRGLHPETWGMQAAGFIRPQARSVIMTPICAMNNFRIHLKYGNIPPNAIPNRRGLLLSMERQFLQGVL